MLWKQSSVIFSSQYVACPKFIQIIDTLLNHPMNYNKNAQCFQPSDWLSTLRRLISNWIKLLVTLHWIPAIFLPLIGQIDYRGVHAFVDTSDWSDILHAFVYKPLIILGSNFVGRVVMGLPWPNLLLVELQWLPTESWPLIGSTVFMHLQTNCWSDWPQIWCAYWVIMGHITSFSSV